MPPASTATLLANGKILILRPDVAGLYSPDAVDAASAFSPFDETSVPGSTALLRSGQTATELSGDKRILVAGGENAQQQPTLQIATFNPARIWTDKDDYQPDDPVLLFGSGWKPNENVYLYAVDSETEQWTYESTVAADGTGNFALQPYFIVQLRQLGTTFDVNAVGAQSALQAAVTFTDASHYNALTVGGASTTPIVGTPTTVTYTVTAGYGGNGADSNDPVSLTFVGWDVTPTLASSPSFSTTSLTVSSTTSTLTINTSALTLAGTYHFTVQGKQNTGGATFTAQGTLPADGPSRSPPTKACDGNQLFLKSA